MIRYKISNNKQIIPKLIKICVSFLLCLTMLSGNVVYATTGAETASKSSSTSESIYDRYSYKNSLISRGFPEDYAEKLAELKLAHPTWSFEPLLISEMNSAYTFDYIINKETLDPATNLVFPSEEYSAFFDTEAGRDYDSGWYSASDDAVRYFMDPRNFLNEQDIFQFEDVSYYDRNYSGGVSGVLDGTFMQSLTLENGMLLRDYLLSIGKELAVSPVHIAARMRQEQGVENTSGMISGECGDLLYYFYTNGIQYTSDGKYVNTPSDGYTRDELLSYNGYYNFFNMGASGTGLFTIYLNAMKRAATGTPEMADEWGGPSWNKMYKSVYGGAYSLKTKYIDDYQNTMYLQKFNVDPRSSRNFWGQYMQNVGAALSEGRSTYLSYKEAGILESEFTFLIPVYSGMPTSCPDPSNGNSLYSSNNGNVSYLTRSDFPYGQNRENSETRGVYSVSTDPTVRIQGWSVHTYGTEYYEISIDGGEFERINSYPRADVREKYGDIYPLSYDVNGYLYDLDTSKLSRGTHSIVIRAKNVYGSYYQVGYLELDVLRLVGDIDLDGSVTMTDFTLLLRYLSGYDVEISGNADLNLDGKINNRDLMELLYILRG